MARNANIQYWGTFSLHEVVEDVFLTLESRMKERAITTELDIPAEQRVTTDRELLKRGIHNLILNAIDAMPTGGSVVITSVEGPKGLELEVADTGESLSDVERREMFGLNTSSHRAGTAWGLGAVHHIAEALGGGIDAVNCPEGGAAFTLRIPLAEAARAAA